MSDDSRINNNQAPYQKYETDNTDEPDTDKFKKIMKVDKSEDSQKKRKRPLKEDDDEDEEVDGTGQTPEAGLFASFMSEDKSSSVFDPQGGGVKNIEVSEGGPTTQLDDEAPAPAPSLGEDDAPPPPNITTSDLDENTPMSTSGGDDADFSNLEPLEEINYNQTVPMQPESDNASGNNTQDSDATNTKQTDASDKPKAKVQFTRKAKPEGEDTEGTTKAKKKLTKKGKVEATTPEEKVLEGKKQDKPTPVKEEVTSAKQDPHLPQETKDTEEPPSRFTVASPQELADKLLAPHASSEHEEKGHEEKDEEHKKHKIETDKVVPLFPHASVDNAGLAPPAQLETPTAHTLPTTDAAMTKLSPEVYELFEKMAGVITIESGHEMTTTSVVVNMEGSVFDGAEVVFNQYKSAQGSYNLELKGSPQAVELFTENLPMLEASFKQGGFNFEVNILPPSLSRKGSSKRVKRKSQDEKREKRQ